MFAALLESKRQFLNEHQFLNEYYIKVHDFYLHAVENEIGYVITANPATEKEIRTRSFTGNTLLEITWRSADPPGFKTMVVVGIPEHDAPQVASFLRKYGTGDVNQRLCPILYPVIQPQRQ